VIVLLVISGQMLWKGVHQLGHSPAAKVRA
jgi:hypothetical protein